MTDDDFHKDILGEQGHRYKRVVLALCIVIIGLSLIPGLNYERLGFLGISAANDVNGKRLVFGVLWLLLTYHAIFLALHAYQDWRDWLGSLLPPKGHLLTTDRFPNFRNYWRRSPDAKLAARRAAHPGTAFRWRRHSRTVWMPQYLSPNGKWMNSSNPFRVSQDEYDSVRRRFLMFLVADCGLPIVLYSLALGAHAYVWT